MALFREKLQKRKIKWPTHRGFTTANWIKEYIKVGQHTDDCMELFYAGILFNKMLTELRSEISCLNKEYEGISKNMFIKSLLGVVNRDAIALLEAAMEDSDTINYFSRTIISNEIDINLTIQEAHEAGIEGLSPILKFLITQKKSYEKNNKTIDKKLILKHYFFSQLQSAFEEYFSAIVMSNYRLIYEAKKMRYIVIQPNSEKESIINSSTIRKLRINHQIFNHLKTSKKTLINNECYISFSGSGNKRKLILNNLKDASEDIKSISLMCNIQEFFLEDSLPIDLLSLKNSSGVSALQLIKVYKFIVLIANQHIEKNQIITDFSSIKDLERYQPKVNIIEFTKNISKALKLDFNTIRNCLKFLEFNENKDIWSFPIVRLDSYYYLILGALKAPIILRTVENWLLVLHKDISSKGYNFEKIVKSKLMHVIKENPFATDYEPSTKIFFKSGETREEIDLLIRIGRLIIVGEAKSIISSDTPKSRFNAFKTLEKASIQVTRKTDFIEANLEAVFDQTGWKFDEKKDYKLVSCIINSSTFFVGGCSGLIAPDT